MKTKFPQKTYAMIIDPGDHPNEIGSIAICLADNFVTPLFNFCGEKNYYAYIGCLAEIIGWAQEFHSQYQNELKDWNTVKENGENNCNAASGHDFLIAWGEKRIKQFFTEYEMRTVNMNRNPNKISNYDVAPPVETGK